MFIAGLLELIVRSNLTGLRYPRRGWIHDWRKIAIALIDARQGVSQIACYRVFF
jgi:hypothetical protein